MSKFIILGAKGVLGRTLFSDLSKLGHEVTGITRENLNIFNDKELSQVVQSFKEATVINCIAFMPADKCELEPDTSEKVNVNFVDSLCKTILPYETLRLIHFSSDFIFSGKANTPYKVDSQPEPINIYGKHKYAAEKIVTDTLPDRSSIIRFASLVSVSTEKKTFLEKVIEQAKKTGEVSVVGDLSISASTSELVSKSVIECQTSGPKILHAVHLGQTTWYGIATCAVETLKLDVKIKKVSADYFPALAERPKYSVLEPSAEIINIDSREWQDAISDYVKRNIQI